MKFASRSELKKTQPTEPGKRMQKVRQMRIDAAGHKILEITGEEDIYEFIQASLEETKIENIIKRATGEDLAKMALTEADVIDLAGAPTSLAEAQRIIEEAKNSFDKLPQKTKEAFDFSAEKFVAEYGSKKWMEALGIEPKNNETPKGAAAESGEVKTNGTDA